VVQRLASDLASGELVGMLAVTLGTMLGGFAIAALAGIAIGIGVARISLLRWFADPLVSVGLPLPKIAFLPIFMLWFGPTDQARIAITAFAAVFPVIVASWSAANSVERSLVWSALSLGCSERALLWQILLPAALPPIFTGLQIALPVALVTSIVAEMMTGSDGLGGAMLRSMRFADSPGVFAGILAIAFLGGLLIKAMEQLRRRLLRWHAEGQG
jgi:ABC-type nitrate/sulfonate/bicarbonate transport system permease component